MVTAPGSQARDGGTPLSGRVVKGRASVPVAGLEVALHRITAREGGVVARGTTDGYGRFRFSLEEADGEAFAVHLVTARYDGVLYFGDPIHDRHGAASELPGSDDPDPEYLVRVYDVRTADSLSVAGRHLAVSPGDRGGLHVVDVVELANPSDSTFVPAEPPGAGWLIRLPVDAREVEVGGGGGLDTGEFEVEGDGVLVRSPLSPPGRALVLRYRIPSGSLRLTADRFYPRMEILVPPDARGVSVDGLAAALPAAIGGARYLRYAAADLPAGTGVALRWEETGRRAWGWIFLAAAVACAGAAILTWRWGEARP